MLAIFRALGVDHRLLAVVEAASLFNDGTAIVLSGLRDGRGRSIWGRHRAVGVRLGAGPAVGVMLLALSLPPSFTHRDLLLPMTFGVVLLTLRLQGPTIRALLRKVGLADSGK